MVPDDNDSAGREHELVATELEGEVPEESPLEGLSADAGPEVEGMESGEAADESNGSQSEEWEAFLRTLPIPHRAIVELYASKPAAFGWLVGRDRDGRLLRHILETSTRAAWARAFAALGKIESGLQARKAAGWTSPSFLATSWRKLGPDFYRLLSVDLPNLRDAGPLLAAMFAQRRHDHLIEATTLAVAELLCSKPLAYWWLVFGPAEKEWAALFAALQESDAPLFASLSPSTLREGWDREGRPLVLAALDVEPVPTADPAGMTL